MSCNNNTPNVNKTFIIEPLSITGGNPTLSACTALYTNLVESCSGDTTISMGTGLVTFNSNVNGINSFTANTIEATTYLSGGTNILDIIDSREYYVTGGTFTNSADTLTITRNDGANIFITGLTDTFVTGGTYDNNTALISFDTNYQLSAFTVDLSTLDTNDTFLTGGTVTDADTLTLRRNDGQDIVINGFSNTFTGNTSGNCIGDLFVSRIHSCSPLHINPNDEGNVYFGSTSGVTIDITNSSISANTVSVSIPTLNNSNTQIITRNSVTGELEYSTLASITGATSADSYTTLAYLSGETIVFDNNLLGSNYYNVDLNPILSGKVDNSTFVTYTATTDSKISTKLNVVVFDSYTAATDTLINSKLDASIFNTYSATTDAAIATKTNQVDFTAHTADASIHYTKGSINLSELGSSAHTHTLSEITDFNAYSATTDTKIDTKLDTSVFNSYSSSTESLINSKASQSDFVTHTGATNPHGTGFGDLSSTAHTHTISDVTGLQTELDNKTDNTNFNTHTADTSVHYTKSSINLSDLGNTAHTHTLSEVTDFNTYSAATDSKINTKANQTDLATHTGDTTIHFTKSSINLSDLGSSAHTHTIGEVNGLQNQLDSKFDLTGGTVNGNVVITGNVDILGTATTINTEILSVEDNRITLNSSASGTTAPLAIDSGIDILRNSATTASILWEESNGYWSAGLSGSTNRIILEGDSLSLLNSAHTHTISEINNLQTELDSKFDTTGGTINGSISAITISADTLYGDGSNLTGVGSSDTGVLYSPNTFTDNGDGTITLPNVEVKLADNQVWTGTVLTYSVSGGTSGTEFTALLDENTNWIYVDYNSGSPQYIITSTEPDFNRSDRARYLTIFRAGNFLHILDWNGEGSGLANKLLQREYETNFIERASGLSLSLSAGTNVIESTGGIVWNGVDRTNVSAANSNDDVFFTVYNSGGTYTYDVTGTTVNNNFYDDGTDLVELTNNRYVVNWIYRGVEAQPHVYQIIGLGQYTSVALAQLETVPAAPELITSHTILVGRIIMQKGATGGVVESAFKTDFAASQVTSHNDLTSLQGGTASEYYHLTNNQYDAVNGATLPSSSNLFVTQNEERFVTGGTYAFSSATITLERVNASNLTITGVTAPPAPLRNEDTTITTGDTLVTISTFSGVNTNTSRFVESYVTAHKDDNDYGFWKRTLAVNNVSGNVTVEFESSDFDIQSSGLTPDNVVYSAIGNTVLVQVTGEVAKTYDWTSTWEVIDEGGSGSVTDSFTSSWTYYAMEYQPSTTGTTVTGGVVRQYDKNGDTVYRFEPSPYDYSLDAFYTNFDGSNVTNIIVSRL